MEDLQGYLKKIQRSSYGNTLRDNVPGAITDPNPACAICSDWGWVRKEETAGSAESGKVEPCTCRTKATEQNIKILEEVSGVGALSRMTFVSADPRGREGFADTRTFRAAFEAAEKYAEKPAGWLFISGVPGTGKTHLAAAIANSRIAQGHSVKYERCPELLDEIRQSGNQPLYDALSAQLLILDDLGMHSPTQWAKSILGRLLNRRYLERIPTVVISDVEINALGLREQAILQDRMLVEQRHILKGIGRASNTDISISESSLESMTFKSFKTAGRNLRADQKDSLERAEESAKKFTEDLDGWLYLSGRTGVGKTHLAVAIANVVELKRPVVFKFVPEMLDSMRRTFDREEDTDFYRMLAHFKDAELLILDDLGSQMPTPWAEEKLYQILVHRHDRKLPTVITSRMLLDSPIDDTDNTFAFSDKYQSAIISRIGDVRVVHESSIHAPDYRNRGEKRVSE